MLREALQRASLPSERQVMLGEIAWAVLLCTVSFWCGSKYKRPSVMLEAIKVKFREWFNDKPAA